MRNIFSLLLILLPLKCIAQSGLIQNSGLNETLLKKNILNPISTKAQEAFPRVRKYFLKGDLFPRQMLRIIANIPLKDNSKTQTYILVERITSDSIYGAINMENTIGYLLFEKIGIAYNDIFDWELCKDPSPEGEIAVHTDTSYSARGRIIDGEFTSKLAVTDDSNDLNLKAWQESKPHFNNLLLNENLEIIARLKNDNDTSSYVRIVVKGISGTKISGITLPTSDRFDPGVLIELDDAEVLDWKYFIKNN